MSGYVYIGHHPFSVSQHPEGDRTKLGLTTVEPPEARPRGQGLTDFVVVAVDDARIAEDRLKAFFVEDRIDATEWIRGLIPFTRIRISLGFAGASDAEIETAFQGMVSRAEGRRLCAVEQISRDAEIRRRRQGGETLQEIGNSYGLTRQRICQITRGVLLGYRASVDDDLVRSA